MVENKKSLFIVALSVVVVVTVIAWSVSKRGARHVSFAPPVVQSVPMDSFAPFDFATDSIVSIYRDSIKSKMLEVVCISDVHMEAHRPCSNLMRFLADVLMVETRDFAYNNGVPAPDISLFNCGGIRDALPAGPISVMNIFQISPFENSAVILEADSAQLMAVAHHIAERGGEAIGGMSLHISHGKATQVLVGGMPLESGRFYYIATLDYLADGGDSFDCLTKLKRFDTNYLCREMLGRYMRRVGAMQIHIRPTLEPRVIVDE